jgi:O-antigen/teichoic acid export membrane protein
MIDYLKYFFNPDHLFSVRPVPMQMRAIIILVVLFSAFIVYSLVVKVFAKKIKDGLKIKLLRKTSNTTLTMGILGLIYVFFAWQSITLLGARFWLVIWALIMLVWGGFILRYFLVTMPKLRSEIDHRRNVEKYLP